MSGGGRGLDPRFMQELKQKNDIAEVIGSYVALDKKGGNYWACCPFHHEKTPSFAVNESEQFYHCFGCGASGDVVKFVQEIESTDFMGAVRILAARAKIPVPESNFDSEKAALLKKKRDALVEILLASARFYLSNLTAERRTPISNISHGGSSRRRRSRNSASARRSIFIPCPNISRAGAIRRRTCSTAAC